MGLSSGGLGSNWIENREGGLWGNPVSLVKLSNVGLIHGEGNKERVLSELRGRHVKALYTKERILKST